MGSGECVLSEALLGVECGSKMLGTDRDGLQTKARDELPLDLY